MAWIWHYCLPLSQKSRLTSHNAPCTLPRTHAKSRNYGTNPHTPRQRNTRAHTRTLGGSLNISPIPVKPYTSPLPHPPCPGGLLKVVQPFHHLQLFLHYTGGMEPKRLNLILDDKTAQSLKDIRHSTDLTYTAIVKRAMKLLDFLLDAEVNGMSLQIVDARGRVVRTVHAFNPPSVEPAINPKLLEVDGF